MRGGQGKARHRFHKRKQLNSNENGFTALFDSGGRIESTSLPPSLGNRHYRFCGSAQMSIAPSASDDGQRVRAHYLRDRNAPNGSRRQVDGYSIKDGFEGGRATIAERRSKTKHNMNDSHGRCLNLCNFGCESECSHDVRDTNLAYGSPSPSFHCMAAPLSLFHVLQNRRNGMEWSRLPWLPG